MSDPYLDHLPSKEREKIRKRLRSPEEYERLREKVKGPEDLEREMEKNAEFAETKLAIETDPKAQEKAKNIIKSVVTEKGIDGAFEKSSEQLNEAITAGNFEVCSDEQSRVPQLAVRPKKAGTEAPSGNVAEIFPLKMGLQQQIVSTFCLKK